MRLATESTGGADLTTEFDSRGRSVRRLWHGPRIPAQNCPSCAVSYPVRLMSRVVYDDLGEHVSAQVTFDYDGDGTREHRYLLHGAERVIADNLGSVDALTGETFQVVNNPLKLVDPSSYPSAPLLHQPSRPLPVPRRCSTSPRRPGSSSPGLLHQPLPTASAPIPAAPPALPTGSRPSPCRSTSRSRPRAAAGGWSTSAAPQPVTVPSF